MLHTRTFTPPAHLHTHRHTHTEHTYLLGPWRLLSAAHPSRLFDAGRAVTSRWERTHIPAGKKLAAAAAGK